MPIRAYRSFVRFVTLVMISMGLAFLTSCVRSTTPSSNNNTSSITATVQSSNNLTLLKQLLKKSKQDVRLNISGPFTLFAPTDAAFASSNIDSLYINNLSDSALNALVLYHIMDSAIGTYYMPLGPNGKLITSSGDSLFVTKRATGIFINGIQITQPDVIATNGFIDAMRFVLLPPKGNILKVVQSDTGFSYLAAAISRASNGSTEVTTLLTSAGPYSLLAPTNSAFQGAGYSTISDVNNANPDSLARILTYHILIGRLFSSDLALGGSANTVNGETVTFYPGTSISLSLQGQKNSSVTNVTTANIMARNGVVHIIDRILLP
ncbi:MAG TPA: fasciclin domain-containing protein [Puia sp.]|nr:fasciclin domain-containing protein [Puia sp.]